MRQIIFAICVGFLSLSYHTHATQCIDGKMTIKEWIEVDGTYLNHKLPKEIINSNACFLKPLDGELLQSTNEILAYISQQMTVDHNRKIPFKQLPKVLHAIGSKYNIYLVKPCDVGPSPSFGCEESDSIILGYVAESTMHLGEKAYVLIDTNQYILN